jgi:hypothetical protein
MHAQRPLTSGCSVTCSYLIMTAMPLQGINRLGRGTAKPGTLRPTDPNRFKTEDFFSVDAEQDPEYIRRVIEVCQPLLLHGFVVNKGTLLLRVSR